MIWIYQKKYWQTFILGDSESDQDYGEVELEGKNLIKEKEQKSLEESKEHGHHDEPILQLIEKICCLVIWPM